MLLKELTLLSGPSGHEDEVRAFLKKEAAARGAQVRCDAIGNVIACKKGVNPDKPHVMIAAHMDEVGFIIRSATDDGLLRIDCVGGIDPRVIVSKRVRVGDEKIPGVIGAMAIHLQTAADMERVLDYDGLYIDIGAKDKEEAQRVAPVGTYAVFDSDYVEFGEGLVKAKALDDRVGCLAALRALSESEYDGDLTCVFTAQEECGLRGAEVAAYRVKPDLALVLEGTASNDMGMTPSDTLKVTRVNKGVAVSFMDRTSIVNRPLFDFVTKTADAAGIPWQIKQLMTGGNDAGPIHKSRAGVPSVVLSTPCRYIHSPACVASYKDMQSQQELVLAVLRALKNDCPFGKIEGKE